MMMTFSIRFAFVSAALLALGSSAHAAEHLLHVGEVLTSKGGNEAIQYIELSDKNSEPFPSTEYVVEIFDAAGASQGEVALDKTKLIASQTAFWIATAAAATEFSKTADAALTIDLDPAGGTACFAKKVASANTYLHCLKWGTATTPTGTSAKLVSGDAPADGKSLQLQSDGSYKVAEPTPQAANVAPAGSGGDLATSSAPIDMTVKPSGTTKSEGCHLAGDLSGSIAMLLLMSLVVLALRRRA